MFMSKRVYFDDLPIDRVDLDNIVDRLAGLVFQKSRRMKTVACLNVNNLNWTYRDREHRQFVQEADLVIPDGWGVVWAGRLLGYHLKERVTTADYFLRFCQMVEKKGFSCYLLGGRPVVINKTAKVLKEKFPQLRIVGFHPGFFNQEEEKQVLQEINQQKPDFLILGMGTPKQEKWLYRNKDHLQAKVGWGVGAVFDYLAGEKRRCPVWLGRLGLEWLFRLLCEPCRLSRRYLWGNFQFGLLCFKIFLKEKNFKL